MITIAQAAALGDDERITFEHCVALALAASRASGAGGGRADQPPGEPGGAVTLLSIHVNGESGAVSRMPEAGPVLARWGADPAAVDHQKLLHECCDEPVDGLLDALRERAPDLVVATTHQRKGLARLLLGSTAQALARNLSVPTLLVPAGSAGFVSPSTGAVEIRHVLVPVGDRAAARQAIEHTMWLADLVGLEAVELVLLHVGDRGSAGEVDVPHRGGWVVHHHDVGAGSIDEAILEAAKAVSLVVMATRGHDSPGDVLLGSHTDGVLRWVSCPVLVVPLAS